MCTGPGPGATPPAVRLAACDPRPVLRNAIGRPLTLLMPADPRPIPGRHQVCTCTFAGNNCSPQPTPGRHRTGSMAHPSGRSTGRRRKRQAGEQIANLGGKLFAPQKLPSGSPSSSTSPTRPGALAVRHPQRPSQIAYTGRSPAGPTWHMSREAIGRERGQCTRDKRG